MMIKLFCNFITSFGFTIACPKFPQKKLQQNFFIGMSFGERFLKPFLKFDAKIKRIYTVFEIEDLIDQFLLN